MAHRLTLISALAITLGAACNGSTVPGYNGYPMDDFFPFDGTCRGWELVSDDVSLPYMMVGSVQPNPDTADDGFTQIWTINYNVLCITEGETCDEGALLRSIKMSTSRSAGTLVYAFDDGTGAQSFDPPLKLTDGTMAPTDTISSESGAASLTTEFVTIGSCDIRWASWDGCPLLTVDDAGTGTGMSGDYWVADGWGIVAWQLDSDSGRWSLDRGIFEVSSADCEAEGLPLLGE